MSTLQTLNTLSYKQLLSVLRQVHLLQFETSSLGFDTARNERTKTKAALCQYIFSSYPDGYIATAVEDVRKQNQDDSDDSEPVEPNKPAETLKPTPVAGSLDALLAGIVQQATQSQVESIITRELAKLRMPRPIEIRIAGRDPKVISGAHPLLPKVLKLLASGLNVLLVGPAGCGKTTLARQAADAMSVQFHRVPYTAGASESWLLGRLLPTGEGGRFEYSSSKALDYWHGPGLVLHDELDAADPNMALILNGLTDNGHFSNPVSGLHHERHAQSYCIAAANTFGTGADMQYVGRSQLDEATRDRWYFVAMDYDRTLELQIAESILPEKADMVCDFVWTIRDKIAEKKLHRTASTRMIEKGLKAINAGIVWTEVKADLLNGWTSDERAAVGV